MGFRMPLLKLDRDGHVVPVTHKAKRNEGNRHLAPERRWRSSYRWQKLRRSMLIVADGCEWCPARSDLTVDHIIPVAEGGAIFERDNLQVLCRRCNSTKGTA